MNDPEIHDEPLAYVEEGDESELPPPSEFYGRRYIPSDQEHTEADYTLVTTMTRVAQDLNLNDISPTEFFFASPLYKDIIFENSTSEARDLDANERNYLSLLRLAMYLGLVGVVVLFNQRLPVRKDSTDSGDDDQSKKKLNLSSNVAIPLGIIFCVLSVCALFATLHNYIGTICGYAKQRSIVPTPFYAKAVIIFASLAIFASNIVFLLYN